MAHKKLKRYALFSEIISAAAVVVSLLFVAFQIKDNTAAVRSSTYDDILSDHIQWRMTVATSPELLANIINAGSNDANLSDVERESWFTAYQALWQIYERAYFARRYGTLGDSEWARYEKAICRHSTLIDIEAELERYLTTEFMDFTNSCNQSNDH
jgi:hypothetical protein